MAARTQLGELKAEGSTSAKGGRHRCDREQRRSEGNGGLGHVRPAVFTRTWAFAGVVMGRL